MRSHSPKPGPKPGPKAGTLHLAAIVLAHLACMSLMVWLSL